MAEGLDTPVAWFAVAGVALVAAGVAVLWLVFVNSYAGVGVAAVGGALAYYALDRGVERLRDRRRPGAHRPLTGRAREMGIAPSFEVYDGRRSNAPAPDRFGPGR